MAKLTMIQAPKDEHELVLDFGDDVKVNMTVDPSRYTVGYQRRLRQAVKDQDVASQVDALFDVVTSWDLEDDDGNPLPLTQEGIDQLRMETVTAIATKMSEALGAPKSGTSNA